MVALLHFLPLTKSQIQAVTAATHSPLHPAGGEGQGEGGACGLPTALSIAPGASPQMPSVLLAHPQSAAAASACFLQAATHPAVKYTVHGRIVL